jgi:hypothetical protein
MATQRCGGGGGGGGEGRGRRLAVWLGFWSKRYRLVREGRRRAMACRCGARERRTQEEERKERWLIRQVDYNRARECAGGASAPATRHLAPPPPGAAAAARPSRRWTKGRLGAWALGRARLGRVMDGRIRKGKRAPAPAAEGEGAKRRVELSRVGRSGVSGRRRRAHERKVYDEDHQLRSRASPGEKSRVTRCPAFLLPTALCCFFLSSSLLFFSFMLSLL